MYIYIVIVHMYIFGTWYFSTGGTPYPAIDLDETFVQRLRRGYRLEKPKNAPEEVYVIIIMDFLFHALYEFTWDKHFTRVLHFCCLNPDSHCEHNYVDEHFFKLWKIVFGKIVRTMKFLWILWKDDYNHVIPVNHF